MFPPTYKNICGCPIYVIYKWNGWNKFCSYTLRKYVYIGISRKKPNIRRRRWRAGGPVHRTSRWLWDGTGLPKQPLIVTMTECGGIGVYKEQEVLGWCRSSLNKRRGQRRKTITKYERDRCLRRAGGSRMVPVFWNSKRGKERRRGKNVVIYGEHTWFCMVVAFSSLLDFDTDNNNRHDDDKRLNWNIMERCGWSGQI